MKKKTSLYLISIIILIIITLPQKTYALPIYDGNTVYKDPSGIQNKTSSGESLDNMITSAEDFSKEDDENTLTLENEELQNLSSLLFNILTNIAVVVSVLVGLYIGIKFMTGSIEQKANIKELLVPYVVGCVVVYGALGIWKLVVTLLQNTI